MVGCNLSDLICMKCNLTSKSKVTVIELRIRSDCSGLEAGVSCVSSGLSQAVAVQLSIYYHDQLSSCENCDKFSLRFLLELQFNECFSLWSHLTSAVSYLICFDVSEWSILKPLRNRPENGFEHVFGQSRRLSQETSLSWGLTILDCGVCLSNSNIYLWSNYWSL